MPLPRRRDTEKRRKFQLEDEVHTLLSWLKTTKDNAARSRMSEVLLLSMNLSLLQGLLRFAAGEKDLSEASRMSEEIDEMTHRRNELLSHYQLIPAYVLLDQEWYLLWLPAPAGDSRPAVGGITVVKGVERGVNEQDALFALIELLRSKKISRISVCDQCKEFFFARFSHQQFCKQKCRSRFRHSTPEWKQYQRNKAREYYRLHKTKNTK